jgi:UDP-glucose 4-epimerase
VRDFVHVRDVADAHLQALDALRRRSAMTLNIGSGRGWSVLEVADAVRGITGAGLPILRRPRRPGDLAVAVADTARAVQEIGWRPRYGLQDMVIHTLLSLRLLPPAAVEAGASSLDLSSPSASETAA